MDRCRCRRCRAEGQCDEIFTTVTTSQSRVACPDLNQGIPTNLFILAFGDPIQKLIVGPGLDMA